MVQSVLVKTWTGLEKDKEEEKKSYYSLHPTGETFCWPVVASTLTSWWPKVECGLMKCPGLAASLPRVSSSSTKMATGL